MQTEYTVIPLREKNIPKMKNFTRLLFCLTLMVSYSYIQSQPNQWYASGISGGGALFSPSISPFDSDDIYIACDMTDLFHTTNAGENWEVVPFQEIRAIHESKVQFTSDPMIRYSVHIDFIPDLRRALKSTDAGISWQTINDPTDGEVFYLYADPTHTNRLLLTDYCTVYFSDNGGQSYNNVYSDCNAGAYIAGVFWDGDHIFVGTNKGLLLSTNGGASFSLTNNGGLPANTGFFSFAGAKENGTTRLLAVVAPQADIWPTVTGAEFEYAQGIYKQDYTIGANWSAASNGISGADKPFFVVMAPTDINIAYAGGGNANTSFPVLFKTTDGGGSWNSVFHTTNNQNITTGWSGFQGDENWWFGEYVLGLAVAPDDPNTVVFTDLGFAHLTKDGGSNWRQMYVNPANENPAGSPTPQNLSYTSNGLENTSAWWMHWLDENNVMAGYSDITGVSSTDGGHSWAFGLEGNSFNSTYQIVEHPNGTLYAAVSSVHDLYQSTYLRDNSIDGGDGGILYSTDGGQNWMMLRDFDNPVVALALDPNDADVLYASVVNSNVGGIYKTDNLSDDNNASWTPLADPPRTHGHPFLISVLDDGTLVCTFSGRRTSGGAFTASSGLFVSTDNGMTWEDRSHPGMHYWSKDLIIDPHDSNQDTWYVCVFSGWGGPPNGLGGIYRTTDRGQNWQRIVNSDRVESLTIHPDNPAIAYFTTEAEGLWYSDNFNNGMNFSPLAGYTFQHPVRVFFNPHDHNEVWVTSFGNGLRRGTSESTYTLEPILVRRASVYPNPGNGVFMVHWNGPSATTVDYEILDGQGRILKAGSLHTNYSGSVTELDLSGQANGLYLLRMWVKGQLYTGKILKG